MVVNHLIDDVIKHRKLILLYELLLLLFMILHIAQGYVKNEKESFVKTTEIQAIEDHTAILYCPLISMSRDKINMVLWFRDNAGLPLYSLDVRGKSIADAQHWSAPQVFGSRARFVVESEPAYLEIDEVKRRDQGVYRCRVDFQNSQTQSFRFNLTVIIPPETPIVLDRWGRILNTSIVGPMEEGDDVILTCRVVGGRPQPDVEWYINGNLVDNQIEQNTGNVIENRLMWPSIQRHQLHSVFTCSASNTKLMEPKYAKFVLDMFLKPLYVQILNMTLTLASHKKYDLVCKTNGSRPDAVITWTKGKKPLKRFKEAYQHNSTISTLNFVPSVEDDGKLLTCRAENPKVTGMYIDSIMNISVHYPPVVNLRLGTTLSIEDIKEGDDIYFECQISSNPSWRKLSWLHNGIPLPQNSSSTKIVRSHQSLVVQKVTRHSSGGYQCSALNSEGETVSNEIQLKIKFVPLCRTDKIVSVGISKGENVVISCDVITHPLATKFYWKFENSEEVIEIDQSRFTSNGTSSQLDYMPVSDQEFGTLSCWAANEIGIQAKPCIYQLIMAGLPSSVINCSWRNFSSAIEIVCHPGYDGGLRQYFVLEMLSTKRAGFGINITNREEPFFEIESIEMIREKLPNIQESDVLKLFVYSVNDKGRSPKIFITELFIPPSEETEHIAERRSSIISPILIGVVVTIVLVVVVVVVRIFIKFKRLKENVNKDIRYTTDSKNSLLRIDETKKDKPPKVKRKANTTTSIKTRNKIETIDDEQDPDLIPYPRLTDIQQEELIPMNSDPSFKKKRVYKEEEISEAELNFKGIEDFLMTNRVPESCV